MYRKIVYTVACGLLFLSSSGLANASEKFDYIDLKNAFTGKTVEGKILKSNTNYKMYFHPSGSLVRLNNESNPEKGKWSINSKNELCLNFDSEACHKLIKRTDESFDLYNQNGDLELTIVKVILGNPDKLKPVQ